MSDEREPLLGRRDSVAPRDMSRKHNIRISRQLYDQEELNYTTNYEKPHIKVKEKIRRYCSSFSCKRWIQSVFPVVQWLPKYRFKRDFLSDLIAGCTVAVLQIPQGIAYGVLANVAPEIGIYTALFPVITYFFLGTSAHASFGTFAVVCLMTGNTVEKFAAEFNKYETSNGTMVPNDMGARGYENLQVATALSMTVALIQLTMFVLRLGIMTNFFSSVMVNSFTTGCAVHVFATQWRDLLGIEIPRRRGIFQIAYKIHDIIMAVPTANWLAVVISALAITINLFNNEYLKPIVAKRSKIPIPMELILLIVATVVSHFGRFHENFGLAVVGNIPTGLPGLTLPPLDLIPELIPDGFLIAIVSYVISCSMMIILATNIGKKIDSNQELLGIGASNLVGSLFSCMPISASLSRSLLQQVIGGVTQIASLVSCAILVGFLMFLGPVLFNLPRCILGSIIVVALKTILFQMKDVVKFWKLSTIEGIHWIATFVTTVFLDIQYGLITGAAMSLIIVFVRQYKPYTCVLGNVPSTDLYLDTERYKNVTELEGIKIFHYSGSLNFASRNLFQKSLENYIGNLPSKPEQNGKNQTNGTIENEVKLMILKFIIVDMSSVTSVDSEGAGFLLKLAKTYAKANISIYLAGPSGPVLDTLNKYTAITNTEQHFKVFPTVHDAVVYANNDGKES